MEMAMGIHLNRDHHMVTLNKVATILAIILNFHQIIPKVCTMIWLLVNAQNILFKHTYVK